MATMTGKQKSNRESNGQSKRKSAAIQDAIRDSIAEQPEQLAPIAFDERDEQSLESVREALWLRPGKRYVIDVIIQCLRLASEASERSPGLAGMVAGFTRSSPGIMASGRMRSFRLLPRERAALDAMRDKFGCQNNAETMRMVVRIAEYAVKRVAIAESTATRDGMRRYRKNERHKALGT